MAVVYTPIMALSPSAITPFLAIVPIIIMAVVYTPILALSPSAITPFLAITPIVTAAYVLLVPSPSAITRFLVTRFQVQTARLSIPIALNPSPTMLSPIIKLKATAIPTRYLLMQLPLSILTASQIIQQNSLSIITSLLALLTLTLPTTGGERPLI